jgi:hypothetical protein
MIIIIIETAPAFRRRILLLNPPRSLLDCFSIATMTNAATRRDEIEEIKEEDDEGGRGAISSPNAARSRRRQARRQDATSGGRRRGEGEGR